MKYILFILLLFSARIGLAQPSEIRKGFLYNLTSYDLIIVKSNTTGSFRPSFWNNTGLKPDSVVFAGDTTLLAITASIVDSSCMPLGLFIDNGVELHKLNTDTVGRGNFFIRDNGILGITSDNHFGIYRSRGFTNPGDLKMAVQTGPMLLWDTKVNTSFGQTSPNKNIRCGVGLVKNGGEEYIVFARSNQPVNYYDFAMLFKNALSCQTALVLESGQNATMHLPGNNAGSNGTVICRYLVVKFQ